MHRHNNINSLQDKKWSCGNWKARLALLLISTSLWLWFNLPPSWPLQHLPRRRRPINGQHETPRKTNKKYERNKTTNSIKQRGTRSIGFNWCINKWSDLGKCDKRPLKIERHQIRNIFKSKIIWACFAIFVSVLSNDAKDKEVYFLFVWLTHFC